MKKYAELNEIENQFCINHAIHLAVVDTFYKKNNLVDKISDSDNSDDEDENQFNSFTGDQNLNIDHDIDNIEYSLVEDLNINEILQNFRKIVRFFRKSPVRNDILQRYVEEKEGKKLKLILDCRTRWNSLIPMMERLVQLKVCLKNALEEMGHQDLYNENNFNVLENLITILKPTELAVKELSKSTSTLLTAEGVLAFLFTQMKQNSTTLGKFFYNSLKIRISERRNKVLITLYKFLQSGNLPQTDLIELPYSPKSSTFSLATTLAGRLFGGADADAEFEELLGEQNIVESEVEPIASGSESLVQQLQQSISAVFQDSKECANDINFESSFQKELKMFVVNKQKTVTVEKLFKALASIQPTSTENERVFFDRR